MENKENHTNYELVVFEQPGEVAQEGARRFAALAGQAIQAQGRFTVALSGGNTPRALHQILASEPYASSIDWQKVFVFFGDERCVPPDHPDSNYRMAAETLLSKVPIPSQNVYRMHGEDDPAEAAQSYASELQQFFKLAQAGGPSPENFPRLDLIFLGMGPDGHTASLFPGTAALQERSRPVAANFVPKLDTNRITLTAPSINRAANVVFLIEGESKAAPLHEVLQGEYQPQIYPSQLIRPGQGKLTFLVDQAAASKLNKA
ncbi:MAG TPA: 6-phosphogluconolactonase [Chloroflexia bacterium]|nr:6-phosphogluconolactonase [Chloroflexia bacterium]